MAKQIDKDAMIHDFVASQANTLKKLALKIHANPELGFEEHKACAWQVAQLKRWKFDVQTSFCGVSTAYRADWGEGKPVLCIMAEYDALPEIGHGCGHNLICTAAMAAAFALTRTMKRHGLKGKVTVMGTPAEESSGGKVKLVKAGAMKGVDAVIMAHPSGSSAPDTGCTAVNRFRVSYKGQSAHAASSPEDGRNALDAVMLLFEGVNAWRQQLPESSRIHGIINEGGVLPNIIPDSSMCTFYLRSPEDRTVLRMEKRFRKIAKGASLMTDTEVKIEPLFEYYQARWPNATLNRLYMEEATQLAMHPKLPDHPGRGSSDFGNVSHMAPSVHVYFGISRKSIPGHSSIFSKAASSSYGLDQMLKAGEALARVGFRYMANPGIRSEARSNFLEDKKAHSM